MLRTMNNGILSSSQNLKTFVDTMLIKFGVKDVWYYEMVESENDPLDPLDGQHRIYKHIPITIAITAWSEELINNTTILQGDKQGWIGYKDELSTLKVGDRIVKLDKNEEVKQSLKIVAPFLPQEYKDEIVAYMVNLRT